MESKPRPPLGLPRGSVRAVLTLLIIGVVIVNLIRGHEVEALWIEALMIALAHYFTSRRFIHFPADVMARLEAEGHVEHEPRPLYLPRHSIRVLIVLAFIGVAVYMYRENRLLKPDSQALLILGVVFAYLLGIVARALRKWWTKGTKGPALRSFADLKALVVLAVLTYVAVAQFLDRPDLAPQSVRNVSLGLVLFYFGSR